MGTRGSGRYLRLAGVLLGACALSACNSPFNILARLDGPYISPERRAEIAYRAAMERQRMEAEAAAALAASAAPPSPAAAPAPVVVQSARPAPTPAPTPAPAAELPAIAAPPAEPAFAAPVPAARVAAAPPSPISPAAGLMGPVTTREAAPAPLETRLPSAFELTPAPSNPPRRAAGSVMQPAPSLPAPAPVPAPAPAAASAAPAPRDLQRAAAAAGLAVVSALPAPDAAPAAARSASSADTLRAFYDFAIARLDGLPAAGDRASMLLADPPSLDPELKRCGNLPPAVLIDLDPGNGLLPLVSSDSASPELARYLGLLRERGVTVYWISGHAPNAASQIRQRLVASGLDPSGTDPLIVTRFAGESKQARRYGLGDSNCLLAIMGDQRGDFDELYDYVLDPIMAAPLEEHVDHGWFLAPPPLD